MAELPALTAKGEHKSVGSPQRKFLLESARSYKSTNSFKEDEVRKRIEPVAALRMPFPETTLRRFLL